MMKSIGVFFGPIVHMKVPFVANNEEGMMVVSSTGASTLLQKENESIIKQGMIVTNPWWTQFECWWYPQQVLMNFHGHVDGYPLGTFEAQLCAYFHQRNVSDWQQQYLHCKTNNLKDGLRRMLVHGMGITQWLEISCGYSWFQHRTLDLYVRVHSNTDAAPPETAWYLLNYEVPLEYRRASAPPLREEWYQFRFIYSMGQRNTIDEWVMDGMPAPLVRRPASDAITQARIRVLARLILSRL